MISGPAAALGAYVKAFETLDPDAVVAFYELPCTFIAPQGGVVASDAATARAVASRLIEQAKGQGYRRTETRDLEVRMLAANLASCTGTFVRYAASGDEITRFGFTYVMRGEGAAWRIAVAVAHDPLPAAGVTVG